MFSNFCDILSGVTQGSVLEPLLFLGYIGNIVQHPSNSEMVLLADDAKMFLIAESNYDIDCFQNDIESVCNWAREIGPFHVMLKNAKFCNLRQMPLLLVVVLYAFFLYYNADNLLFLLTHCHYVCKYI